MTEKREIITDRIVLLVISGGLILILLSIIVGLFAASRPGFTLPNWAENVLVAIATASALKLGDCLATLVALSQGRQIGHMGTQLAGSAPGGTGDGTPSTDAPLGTPEDPLSVVGAKPGAKPVITKDEKK